MADYYPLIVRAIAGLDANAPGESRRALYERARAALIAQLRSVQPSLSEAETTRERLAMEEAIRKVESEIKLRETETKLRDELSHQQEVESEQTESDPLAELARLIGQTDPFRSSPREEYPSAVHPLHRYPAHESDPDVSDDTEGGLPTGPPEWLRRARMSDRPPEGADKPPITMREGPQTYRPPTPPINVIPEQDLTRAIGFGPTRKGPLDLVLDPPTDPHDREQSELYARIRRQLKKLKEEIPSQERAQVNEAIDDFLDNHPDEWSKVEFKKLVWLSGNSLRTLLAQHDAVKDDPEHYSKLPPSVAEALRGPVQAWSVFVQGDPQMALLDYYSHGPRERQQVRENLKAAEQVVLIASRDRRIVTERAADAIDATMKSASVESTDVNTKLVQELADKTSRNFISQIIRQGYLLVEALANPDSQEAKELRLGVARGLGYGIATTAAITLTNHIALPFLEFVATNLPVFKQYVVVAFQNPQMIEIVDALEFEHNRLKRLINHS
jgi:hypothetical protein